MKISHTDQFFSSILRILVDKCPPVLAFFIFVLAYFLFVFFIFGYSSRQVLIKEIRESSLLQKMALGVKTFLGIYILYFLFYRLMIMTAVLDYPVPKSIEVIGQAIINFFELVGLLK